MRLVMKVDYHPEPAGDFLSVDPDRCTACGRCAAYCTRGVWEKSGRLYRPVRPGDCVECGACWNVCAAGAIELGEPHGGTGVRFSYG
ncbi:MAG: ferredoxin family protein [Thermoleophilia bacterium]|nr:ferredoxin family protein [Thermoleophilia bacterium]